MPKVIGQLSRATPPSAADTEPRARLKSWINDVVDHISGLEADLLGSAQEDVAGALGFRGYFDNEAKRYAMAGSDFLLVIDPGIIVKDNARLDFAGDTLAVPSSGVGKTYVYVEIVKATDALALESATVRPDFDGGANYNVLIGDLDEVETGVWEWSQYHLGTYTMPTLAIYPAKIVSYSTGTDTHTVDLYANGFGETATDEDIELDTICNLPASKELAADTELVVVKAGAEYIGIVVPMTKVTNITDIRLETATNDLQIKTTDQYVFAPDAESDWVTVTDWTTTDCTTTTTTTAA